MSINVHLWHQFQAINFKLSSCRCENSIERICKVLLLIYRLCVNFNSICLIRNLHCLCVTQIFKVRKTVIICLLSCVETINYGYMLNLLNEINYIFWVVTSQMFFPVMWVCICRLEQFSLQFMFPSSTSVVFQSNSVIVLSTCFSEMFQCRFCAFAQYFRSRQLPSEVIREPFTHTRVALQSYLIMATKLAHVIQLNIPKLHRKACLTFITYIHMLRS